MRTIWNGSISFGLVNIPIGLARRDEGVGRLVQDAPPRVRSPIKQKRWCPVHERDVEADELVKGWEVAKGQFIVVEEESWSRSRSAARSRSRSCASSRSSRSTRSTSTAPTTSRRRMPRRAPPVRPAAAGDAGDRDGRDRQVRALGQGEPLPDPRRGTTCSRSRRCSTPRTCARAGDQEAVEATEVKEVELDLARQVIASLAGEFEPEEFGNEYRRELRAMLDAKLAGRRSRAGAGRRGADGRSPRGAQASVAEAREPAAEEGEAGREERRAEAQAERRRRARPPERAAGCGEVLPMASRAGSGTASCRSSRGRSARLPRIQNRIISSGRSQAPSRAPRASDGSP